MQVNYIIVAKNSIMYKHYKLKINWNHAFQVYVQKIAFFILEQEKRW